MIIGIEGTGSQEWGPSDLQHSFVRRILEQSTMRPKYYFIGPNNEGSDMPSIVNGAWRMMPDDVTEPLVLLGYSRGAAYVFELAKRFDRKAQGNCEIKVLMLFDCVQRQYGMSLDADPTVPDSVANVIHAYRDPRAGSRFSFSNVQPRTSRGPGKHATIVKRMFFGSHGALGGTYWDARSGEANWQTSAGNSLVPPDDRQLLNIPRTAVTDASRDKQCSEEVARWVWPQLKALGVLPNTASLTADASPFKGSKTPGAANAVP
jgi:hypothetical protein